MMGFIQSDTTWMDVTWSNTSNNMPNLKMMIMEKISAWGSPIVHYLDMGSQVKKVGKPWIRPSRYRKRALSSGSDVVCLFANAVLNRTRQVEMRTPARAHTKTRSVGTWLKAASACLRHCQEMVRQSIAGIFAQGNDNGLFVKMVTCMRIKISKEQFDILFYIIIIHAFCCCWFHEHERLPFRKMGFLICQQVGQFKEMRTFVDVTWNWQDPSFIVNNCSWHVFVLLLVTCIWIKISKEQFDRVNQHQHNPCILFFWFHERLPFWKMWCYLSASGSV